MNVKRCSTKLCTNNDVVAMQRQIQMIPSTDQPLHRESIVLKYFCKFHFERDELKNNIRLIPATALINGKANQNCVVYSNRKRKINCVISQAKRTKCNDDGRPPYTLSEAANAKDYTKVNVSFHEFKKFDSEDYEDSEPTFLEPQESESANSTEDNDCIITNEEAPIIDITGDECQDESTKMIDLILCNDIEPEPAEMANEYVYEMLNELEDENLLEPVYINSTALQEAEEDVGESIDLTVEQNNENADGEGDSIFTIDLTNEQMTYEDISLEFKDLGSTEYGVGIDKQMIDKETNEEVYDSNVRIDEPTSSEEANVEVDDSTTNSNVRINDPLASDEIHVDSTTESIERIRSKLNSRYPLFIRSISWNDETKKFEVSLTDNNRQKVDDEFHKFLREVVNEEVQTKRLIDKVKPTTRVIENASNEEYEHELQEMVKQLVTNKKRCSTGVTYLTSLLPAEDTQLISNAKIVRDCNANQMLKSSETYLGVTDKTFHTIEDILKVTSTKRPTLILLLRKIKLNESFELLSNVFCPEGKNCFNMYKNFLMKSSRSLRKFLRWPPETQHLLSIVDVFEIELKKPKSLVEQNMIFCRQTKRYAVKFIICCTSTGYISHVSPPFHSIQAKILMSCAASIQKCAVCVNPNLMNFGKNLIRSNRIASLFHCDRQAERNVIGRVFDRLRRFSLINSVTDLENVHLVHHALQVAATLCNLEEEKEEK